MNPDNAQFNFNRTAINLIATAKRLAGASRTFSLSSNAHERNSRQSPAQTQIGKRRRKAAAHHSCTLQAGDRRVNAGRTRCEQAVIPVADTSFRGIVLCGKAANRAV
jgi:hypothetical protein